MDLAASKTKLASARDIQALLALANRRSIPMLAWGAGGAAYGETRIRWLTDGSAVSRSTVGMTAGPLAWSGPGAACPP
jgi:hypothetical protein